MNKLKWIELGSILGCICLAVVIGIYSQIIGKM